MAKFFAKIILIFLFATCIVQLSIAARLSKKLAPRGRDLSSPVFGETTQVPAGHSCCSSTTSTKSCSVGCPPHQKTSATSKIVNEVHLASEPSFCAHNNPPHGVCTRHCCSATSEPITEVRTLSSEPPCCAHDDRSRSTNVMQGLVLKSQIPSSSPSCVSNGVPCKKDGIIPPTPPHLAGSETPVP